MIRISNDFAIIGTNPEKYFRNYCNHLNGLALGETINVNWEQYQILYEDKLIFSFGSEATLRQNIDAWLYFGFFEMKNKNEYIKIIKWHSEDELYEIIKANLLEYNSDHKITKHRNTILLKILFLTNSDLLVNKIFYSSTKQAISFEKINQEIGKFEKHLSQDKEFIKMVQILGEEFNGNKR